MLATVYDTWSVPASLSTVNGATIALTAKDMTVPSSINGFGVDYQAFKPIARVRVSELPDLVLEDELVGGEFTIGGKTWSIKSYEPVATPNSIFNSSDGEINLILKDDLNV